MNKVEEYLWDRWDLDGIVDDLETIEEALETVISYDEALDIPKVVERFLKFIRPHEGVILFQTKRAAKIG